MLTNLSKALNERTLLLDGGMGTLLQEAGLPGGVAPEIWNVERPDAVAAVHQAYLEAGADLIETNTFGANPVKLALYGLADRTEALNAAGVALARRAAAGRAWVVASVGPTGRLLAPFGDLSTDEARRGYMRQVTALAAAGAEAINIETMTDLVEMRLAIEAALTTGLPVMGEVVLTQSGRTLYGSSPEVVGVFLSGFPLAGAGFNCGVTPEMILPAIPRLRKVWPGPIIAQPNAGQPGEYLGPEEFASMASRLLAAGVAVIGGCCGTTPAHIACLHRLPSRTSAMVPPVPLPGAYIASRTIARALPDHPEGPVVVVRHQDQDLLGEAMAYPEAETLVFDLRRYDGSAPDLGAALAAIWPALTTPAIFVAGEEAPMKAAITSYPGRPGVRGESGLAAAAKALGALWLG